MEPRIQYARSNDGVGIAFWTLGKGHPLLCGPPLLWSNIALEWEMPGLRNWYERLASSRMLIRFDARGQGRSQRDVEDYSLDAFTSDLAAVAGRLQLERLDVLAFYGPAKFAIALAARHPETVSRLVLWGANVHERDTFGGQERQEALYALAERDWDLAVESWAHALVGWTRGQVAHEWAEFIRASVEQRDWLRMWRYIPAFSVESLLPQISASTLVVEPSPSVGFLTLSDHSALLASNIPNAEIARLRSEAAVPYEDDEGMRVIEEFLAAEKAVDEVAPPSGMTAILFADIVDSTVLTERFGDTAFRDKARDLDAALRSVIRSHTGTPIEGKLLGDGVLAVFTSARQAIEAALACGRAGDEAHLPLHLGIHAGDVIREDNNVYGGAVNIASRISGLSAPGEVLVSRTITDLARTSAGVTFEDRGEYALKGVAEPVRVFAVGESGGASQKA